MPAGPSREPAPSWVWKRKKQLDKAIEDWLRKNKDQVSLDSYMKQGTAKPVIFQNITLQRIQITIIKSELQRLVRVLASCEPPAKMDFLKEIQKILPSAFSLLEETRDPELQELITQVEFLAKTSTVVDDVRSSCRNSEKQ